MTQTYVSPFSSEAIVEAHFSEPVERREFGARYWWMREWEAIWQDAAGLPWGRTSAAWLLNMQWWRVTGYLPNVRVYKPKGKKARKQKEI